MIDSMGLALTKKTGLTVEEFLAWLDNREALGDQARYELVDGEIVAMVGTTLNHSRVVTNLARRLGNHLEGTRCEVWSESVLVKAREDQAFLPDVFVTCQSEQPGRSRLADPPLLLIEVLSPSNHRHDRSTKLDAYQRMPGVQQYVIVDPMSLTVESHVRQHPGGWTFQDHTTAGLLWLPSIDLELKLSDIFARVDLT